MPLFRIKHNHSNQYWQKPHGEAIHGSTSIMGSFIDHNPATLYSVMGETVWVGNSLIPLNENEWTVEPYKIR